MKAYKLIFTLLSICCLWFTSEAQRRPALVKEKGGEIAKAQTDSLIKKLQLGNEQASKLNELENAFIKKYTNIPETLSLQERSEKIKELNSWKEQQMKIILSKKQYELYIQLIEERKQQVIIRKNQFKLQKGQ